MTRKQRIRKLETTIARLQRKRDEAKKEKELRAKLKSLRK